MGWMKIAGFVIVLGLLAACDLDAKTPNQCQTDDQCREGAYCDVGRALCVTACEKVGCLEGHFCDPSAHTCGTECSFGCTTPENATAICRAECGYTCNPGSHLCGEQCPLNTDATACGTSCKVCPVPDYGTATCSDGVCGSTCNAGFYDNAGSCKICDVPEHCGASCTDCSATYQICNAGACITNPNQYAVNTTSAIDQPTVLDAATNLIWQGCTAGLTGDSCEHGSVTPMTWWAAADDDPTSGPDEDYCRTLSWGGYATGWRLPKEEAGAQELSSILLEKTSPCSASPCIDAKAFPNTPTDRPFWSSSLGGTSSGEWASAWTVGFATGGKICYTKSSPNCVRCVRSGP